MIKKFFLKQFNLASNLFARSFVIYTYTCSCRIHIDAMNNRRRKTSLTKYLPLTSLQGFERVIQGLRVRERVGDRT